MTAEDLIRSNWASEPIMYGFIPKYVPRPIAAGRYKSMDDAWFFLMEWVDMVDGPDKVDGENKPAGSLPSPEVLVPPVVALHSNSWGKCPETSPEKKFGASVNFWFGSLCLQNGWTSTWETWWINRMTQAFDKEAEARGPLATEYGEAVRLFLTKVLPRYLRPMESNGSSITPCLVHTDLWPGNFKLRKDEGSCVIFDSNPVWGHNERESMRPAAQCSWKRLLVNYKTQSSWRHSETPGIKWESHILMSTGITFHPPSPLKTPRTDWSCI